MIRHMLFWNRAEGAPARDELLPSLQESFSEMVGSISGLRLAQVDFDEGVGTHEIGLYTEFDSMEALNAYQVHPLHLVFKEKLGPCLRDRVCVDLEVAE